MPLDIYTDIGSAEDGDIGNRDIGSVEDSDIGSVEDSDIGSGIARNSGDELGSTDMRQQ